MKRRSLPLWLLRDVPALFGVMFSFWPLMILVIRSGFAAMRGKKVPKSVFDAIPILLAHAEARLDFALWREAYRRLGWSHRLVMFGAFAPPQDWPETEQRFEAYRRANMNLEATVRAYVDHLRAQYGISQRDLVAHGSTDARLRRAAHHELAPARAASARPSTCPAEAARRRKDERGYAHARGPPLNLEFRKPPQPTSPALASETAPACA